MFTNLLNIFQKELIKKNYIMLLYFFLLCNNYAQCPQMRTFNKK